MTFGQVEGFLVLAEELHFGRTATRLHLTSARVSQLVRDIEQLIGEPLFLRTSRKVELTPQGKALLAELRPAYWQLTAAIENAKGRAARSEQTLRIAYNKGYGVARIHAYASAFERAYPEATVSTIVVDETINFAAPVRDGTADIQVKWLPDNPQRFAGLEPDLEFSATLASSQRGVVVGPDHPWAGRESIQVEELADHELTRPPKSVPDWYIDSWSIPTTPNGRPIRRRELDANWSLVGLMDGLLRHGRAFETYTDDLEAIRVEGVRMVPIDGLPPCCMTAIRRKGDSSPLMDAFIDIAQQTAVQSRGRTNESIPSTSVIGERF
ncbi:LysR family transcriptional regulator [Nocardia sp. KC 131]|uniref:LysR family transcriptional regulator n=1 Tax=Nocardia arseniciresistens TaxID=3392119 RepID=UPI00398E331A